MKKILVLLLALIFSFGCFACAGCGGGDDGNGKIVLKVAIEGTSSENRLMREWKKVYEEKNPEIQINITTIKDYSTSLQTYEKKTDTMPDIIWTTGEQHVVYSGKGMFINLKDRINGADGIDLSDFYDSMIQITHKTTNDTGIYFIPRDYNKCVLIINKVVFKACGFSDDEINNLKNEWNYDKFLSVCARLRAAMDANTNPELGAGKDCIPLDASMTFNASYLSWINHFGGALVETDGTTKSVNFISDNMLDAYLSIYDLIHKKYIASWTEKAEKTFDSVMAAMKIDVRPGVPTIPTNDSGIDIDFLPLPLDQVGIGCSGYAISKMAKERVSTSALNTKKLSNEDYAFDFLKFIVSAEGQRLGAKMGSIIPVLKSLAEDESWTAYRSADLNHAAFVSYPEKDFDVNVYRDFAPDAQGIILDNWSKVIGKVLQEGSYSGGKASIKSILEQFQQKVSGFTA